MRGLNPRGRALEEGLNGNGNPAAVTKTADNGGSGSAGFGGDDVAMDTGSAAPAAGFGDPSLSGDAPTRSIADPTRPDVEAHAPVPTGCVSNVFNPGWETDCANLESTRHCPAPPSFHSDLELCAPSCWWPAVVPDTSSLYPDWLDDCNSSIWQDWQQLCYVPDHG